MVPDLGATNPAIALSNVDFPQPEGPKTATKLCEGTNSDNSSKALVSP